MRRVVRMMTRIGMIGMRDVQVDHGARCRWEEEVHQAYICERGFASSAGHRNLQLAAAPDPTYIHTYI